MVIMLALQGIGSFAIGVLLLMMGGIPLQIAGAALVMAAAVFWTGAAIVERLDAINKELTGVTCPGNLGPAEA